MGTSTSKACSSWPSTNKKFTKTSGDEGKIKKGDLILKKEKRTKQKVVINGTKDLVKVYETPSVQY